MWFIPLCHRSYQLQLLILSLYICMLYRNIRYMRYYMRHTSLSLPTAHFVALRSPFPFRQAQHVQVFTLRSAPFCKLSAGAGSTNKSAISLLFSESRFVISSVFPFTSNSMADLTETVFSLFLNYQATMGPRTLVFPTKRCG